MPRYAVISPVFNEAEFVGPMIASILCQDVVPAKWIFVDDGSTDGTVQVLNDLASLSGLIEVVRLPAKSQRRPGGEGIIQHALKRLDLDDYEYLARFDADLLFDKHYMLRLFQEFDGNPKLGIAGGELFIERRNGTLQPEKQPVTHVRGALKMYRMACFKDIGGLAADVGWDMIDETDAWTKGWETRSFPQCKAIHRRPTGEGISRLRYFWQNGRAEYLSWADPLFVILKAAKIFVLDRVPLGALFFAAAFFFCYIHGVSRLQEPQFVASRRKYHRSRLRSWFTARHDQA
ncbi:MAG: glycosyl transferase family 2 [Acidobacteriaceae bacterium]|nr:glycosyl transferase family 2 [Acidobacteriaceae bacterium]